MPSVLIVDDSPTARLVLRRAIEQDPELSVVAEAENGAQALEQVRSCRPDIVTMDVVMRRENGIAITAEIMAQSPCPIVIVTAHDLRAPELVYEALRAGALDVVAKLPGPGSPSYEPARQHLVSLLKRLARTPTVGSKRGLSAAVRPEAVFEVTPTGSWTRPRPRIVVIGASTGGPPLVAELLRSIPRPYPLPIAVAQHIAPGFGQGLAQWLESLTGQSTVMVTGALPLVAGRVYLAPDDGDLHIRPGQLAVRVAGAQPTGTSVDALFTTTATTYGAAAVGLLLSGMGQDGLAGMRALRQAGASTIAQNPETCVVSSMPRAVIRAGVASRVLDPVEMAKLLEWIAVTNPVS